MSFENHDPFDWPHLFQVRSYIMQVGKLSFGYKAYFVKFTVQARAFSRYVWFAYEYNYVLIIVFSPSNIVSDVSSGLIHLQAINY